MEEELTRDKTGDNQFSVFIFLVLGLSVLMTTLSGVFFRAVWIIGLLSAASILLATIVFLQLETRGRNPWLWAFGIFLVMPVIYFVIASVIG